MTVRFLVITLYKFTWLLSDILANYAYPAWTVSENQTPASFFSEVPDDSGMNIPAKVTQHASQLSLPNMLYPVSIR